MRPTKHFSFQDLLEQNHANHESLFMRLLDQVHSEINGDHIFHEDGVEENPDDDKYEMLSVSYAGVTDNYRHPIGSIPSFLAPKDAPLRSMSSNTSMDSVTSTVQTRSRRIFLLVLLSFFYRRWAGAGGVLYFFLTKYLEGSVLSFFFLLSFWREGLIWETSRTLDSVCSVRSRYGKDEATRQCPLSQGCTLLRPEFDADTHNSDVVVPNKQGPDVSSVLFWQRRWNRQQREGAADPTGGLFK